MSDSLQLLVDAIERIEKNQNPTVPDIGYWNVKIKQWEPSVPHDYRCRVYNALFNTHVSVEESRRLTRNALARNTYHRVFKPYHKSLSLSEKIFLMSLESEGQSPLIAMRVEKFNQKFPNNKLCKEELNRIWKTFKQSKDYQKLKEFLQFKEPRSVQFPVGLVSLEDWTFWQKTCESALALGFPPLLPVSTAFINLQ